jgi:hypothetical protein
VHMPLLTLEAQEMACVIQVLMTAMKTSSLWR